MPIQNAGITLIALIITIILLLILAGVAIHFTIGENGILKNASIAGEKYEESNVKEQLTLELANIQTKTYKEAGKKATLEDVKNLINHNKYDVTLEEGRTSATIEDIENEYTFIVDEKLIIQDVEKITNQDTSIKIETSATNKSDYTTSTLKATITLTEEIASIKIGGEEIELVTPTNEGGNLIYEVEKEVEKNGNYKIKVETVSGRTNYKIEQVKDLSEDMEIRTAEELAWFRDRINNGATYKGRTIKVMNDLDLRNVCNKEKPWESIGKYNYSIEKEYNKFSGIFNGNNKTIDYLYIKNSEELSQGLFGYTVDAEISGVIIGINSSINAFEWTGGVVGYAQNTVIQNCGNNSDISIVGECAGGIAGVLDCGEIIGCYNKGNITSSSNCIGGICGNTFKSSSRDGKCVILYSYNTGIIKSKLEDTAVHAYVGGICGYIEGFTEVGNCYNNGNITGERENRYGGCVGGSISRKYSGISNWVVDDKAKNEIKYTCNIGNVNGSGIQIGGICGFNNQYCIVKNNYILSGIEVKSDATSATKDVGESSTYIGKYVGRAYDNSKTYIDGNGEITNTVNVENEDITDTVYYIVNGMSDEESEYWDKGNPTEPKLKWEL